MGRRSGVDETCHCKGSEQERRCSDEREGQGYADTDVVAHLTGLGAGFLIGLYVARTRLHLSGPQAQRFFAWTAIAIVGSAWMLAG